MSVINADRITTILDDLVHGDNRATIETEPGLAWYLPELDALAARIPPLLGRAPTSDATIREELAVLDAEHDDAHRFIYHTLLACEARGTTSDRAAVVETRRALYPHGLSAIRASYHEEVAGRHEFADKVASPRVARGIDVAARQVRGLVAAIADVDRALVDMEKTLKRIDDADDVAERESTARVRTLLDARREVVSLLTNFADTVEFLFRRAHGDRAARAEHLLREWRRGVAESERAAEIPVQ